MSLTLQPVRVGNGFDEEGMLVFDEVQRLVAVLTHLSDQYGNVSGHWYLEAKFGLLDGLDHPTYTDLDAAQDGISQHLVRRRRAGPPLTSVTDIP
jgi:hypothetical protein